MGLLDRLKSIVTTMGGTQADLRGPLGLQPGDGIGYYKERFVVAGVRRLVANQSVTWQYCMRDPSGAATVLAVEPGAEPVLWLQRVVAANLPWDKDVIEGVGDDPLKLVSQGIATVEQIGDPGTPPSRHVKFRHLDDPDHERRVVLEDYQGHREVRACDRIHEAELLFVRTAETGSLPAGTFGAIAEADDEASRGSPDAALAALSESHDCDVADLVGEETPEDRDPTDFDDAEWSDDEGVDDPSISTGPKVEAVLDSEDDEWGVAAKYLRENGSPAESIR